MKRLPPIDRQAMYEVAKPEAFWFGREGASCFGMLHQPAEASTRGVIFCNALGFEGLLAHRAFRHMADDLTARGFWALRFDYDGEGDSAGGPWKPRRVDAWIKTIDDAVGVMRARGVTDVRLVGFRMGASLACLYATAHPGISSVVLWSPCVRGAAYVRELRALSRLSAVVRPPQRGAADPFPDDALEVVGFELAGETLRDLAEIDLDAAPVSVSPPSILLMDRDDGPANDGLARKLADVGSGVEHERMSGYEDFVTESEQTSVLPWPIMRRIVDWLDAARPELVPPGPSAPPPPIESAQLAIGDAVVWRASGTTPGCVIEEPLWVDGRFFAICSRPADATPFRPVSIVLCNTGSVNRTGPGRMYVNLARSWAALGFTVLRVDLGGCGDSLDVDPPTENDPLAPARIKESREVIEWSRRWTGFDQVVACGMCSGAFNTFQAVIAGLDIDHLMLVNPGFYREVGESALPSQEKALHSAHALTRGMINRRRWMHAMTDREAFLRGVERFRELFGKTALSGYRVLAGAAVRNAARKVGITMKAPSPLARDLDDMIARGVKVLMVFAASESSARYLRTSLGPAAEALASKDELEVVNVDGGDHIFSPPGARQQMAEAMTDYLERAYASYPAVSA